MLKYKVKRDRVSRRWHVLHVHKYPNYEFEHSIHSENSWELCMFRVTGDPFYLPDDIKTYGTPMIICGFS